MTLPTPILFCIFNRPALTRQVFEAIRHQRPQTLLVVQDGPRADRKGEADLVAETRRILEEVDWDCDVRTNFANENLGCKQRMASGISWGFDQFERLIILEDDCLPSESFFGFSESLLNRFDENERVMMISGDNFLPKSHSPHSYYFSKWTHIWGWASWRRAWRKFDLEMSDWPDVRESAWLESLCCDEAELEHWNSIFDRQHAGLIDTWDYSWMYNCWRHNGLTVLPHRNLVTNIGFGDSATHTLDVASPLANMPRREMGPLLHPAQAIRNVDADAYSWSQVFKPRPMLESFRPSKTANWRNWWHRIRRAAS